MKLKQFLTAIDRLADQKGLSRPFIVGGITRDKLSGHLNQINDIDLTTGDTGIHYLAKEIAIKFRGPYTQYEVMSDGHARVTIGELKLDFSSNFNLNNIDNILQEMGIENPTEMQKEIYSRDFTCNTLLMSLDLKTIQDTTRRGALDIKNKLLRTCLPPSITLAQDNKRVARIIYLVAKLGFAIDPAIVKWVNENPSSLANVRADYLAKKLKKSLTFNKELTLKTIDQLGLWPYVPPLPEFVPYLSRVWHV